MAQTGTFGYRIQEGRQVAVKVEGLSQTRKALKNLSDDLKLAKGEFKDANKQVAEVVIGEAKRYVPVLSGALAASLRDASTVKSARVRAGGALSQNVQEIVSGRGGVEYAGPIHFGWPKKRIRPNPFIYDAIDRRRNEVAQKYADRLSEIRFRYDL
jgi:hypothetical protein